MAWWAWLLIGFMLVAAEVVSTGLFLLFFGISALIVGALVAGGLINPAWVQWLLFSVIAAVSVALFRKPLMLRLKLNQRKDQDTMIGETARASEDIPANAQGKAELRGSTWMARNAGAAPILRGQICKVERVEGIVLIVRGD